MYWKFLSAWCCTSCKKNSFSFFFFQKLKYALVIKIRVIIMHFFRIRAVEPFYIGRNTFSEICFETIHSHIQKCFQLTLVPAACIWIGKVYQSHTSLPHIQLPNSSIVFHQKIALFHGFSKQRRLLCNIGIDPNTDF